MRKLEAQAFECVWDALEPNPDVAADLRARSELMCELRKVIRTQRWQPGEAATHCGVSSTRISDLMHDRISRLSLATLRAMVARAISGAVV